MITSYIPCSCGLPGRVMLHLCMLCRMMPSPLLLMVSCLSHYTEALFCPSRSLVLETIPHHEKFRASSPEHMRLKKVSNCCSCADVIQELTRMKRIKHSHADTTMGKAVTCACTHKYGVSSICRSNIFALLNLQF